MVGRADLRLRFANPLPRGRLPPSARTLGYKQAAGLFASRFARSREFGVYKTI